MFPSNTHDLVSNIARRSGVSILAWAIDRRPWSGEFVRPTDLDESAGVLGESQPVPRALSVLVLGTLLLLMVAFALIR